MKGHGTKFGRKKEEAIAALLSQRSIEEASRVAGIGVNTLQRWLKEPEFKAAYYQARRATFEQTVARMQQASGAAASTVLRIMTDASAPPAVRLRAATCILDCSSQAISVEELELRILELERRGK
jgi:hypothetical protein